jgi:hypothetical protein
MIVPDTNPRDSAMKSGFERAIFLGHTKELAQRVADVLTQQHAIPCEVVEVVKAPKVFDALLLYFPLLRSSPISTPDFDVIYGAAVRVLKPTDVSVAKKWVTAHAQRIDRWQRELTVWVRCDECETNNVFPRSLSGTVQSCRRCQRFVDIPGDDPDWDSIDWRQDGETDELN